MWTNTVRSKSISQEIKTELFRKSIHVLIGMTPLLAAFSSALAMLLLTAGIVVYTIAESMRLQGFNVPIISRITRLASRERDKNKAVLGPITLGLGALLCLMLYPEPAATVGIYALAFGDGLSSLVGKLLGRVRIPLTRGKTLEGSLTAFVAIFVAAYSQKNDVVLALSTAAFGTVLEMLPTQDLDNLLIPLGTALFFAVASTAV